ncbi:hypothetical protein ABHI18_003953 [Aspergillus niger]
MPVVWRLHASTRLKLGIFVTFLLGSLGLVSSIIRFWEFYVTDAEGDRTWAAATLVIWAVIEGGGLSLLAHRVKNKRTAAPWLRGG